MEARLQLRVQRYGWDKAAPLYEGYWAAQLEPAQDRLLELAALRPGERVLDVACGTGLVTFRAAEAVGAAGRVTATDISETMVRGVEAVAAARGLTHVSAQRAHAAERVFDPGTFDVVLCALGLMYVPDVEGALDEMRRVLRPGGRMVAAVWGARAKCGWADIFPIVDRRVQSEVCPMFFHLGTGDTLHRMLEARGFTDVHVDRLATTLHYDSADQAVGAAFAGGPVALAYSRFDEPTREAAHAEYLESIAPFRRESRYEIPGEFVIARATRSLSTAL